MKATLRRLFAKLCRGYLYFNDWLWREESAKQARYEMGEDKWWGKK